MFPPWSLRSGGSGGTCIRKSLGKEVVLTSESFLAGTQFFFVHVAANGVLMVDFYPH